jgi:hypothetical protein
MPVLWLTLVLEWGVRLLKNWKPESSTLLSHGLTVSISYTWMPLLSERLRIHPQIGVGLERTASNFEMPERYILPPELHANNNV